MAIEDPTANLRRSKARGRGIKGRREGMLQRSRHLRIGSGRGKDGLVAVWVSCEAKNTPLPPRMSALKK